MSGGRSPLLSAVVAALSSGHLDSKLAHIHGFINKMCPTSKHGNYELSIGLCPYGLPCLLGEAHYCLLLLQQHPLSPMNFDPEHHQRDVFHLKA
jgi:hypothetical protein